MRRIGLWIAVGLFSCTAVPQRFVCAMDEQCPARQHPGRCEPTGDCSFYDATCPSSERRYAEYSDRLRAGACVPAAADRTPPIAHEYLPLADMSGQDLGLDLAAADAEQGDMTADVMVDMSATCGLAGLPCCPGNICTGSICALGSCIL